MPGSPAQLAAIAKANAAKAANRQARNEARARNDGTLVPLQPGAVDPTGGSEIQSSSTLEPIQGISTQVRDAMLDRIGFTQRVRDRVLKQTLNTLIDNLAAMRVSYSGRGLAAVPHEAPDGLVRNKAAELLCRYFGLETSRQPEAMRIKTQVALVRQSFARPRPVIERPVTDNEGGESPTDGVKTS